MFQPQRMRVFITVSQGLGLCQDQSVSRACNPLVSSQVMSPNPDELLWSLQSLPLCDFWAAPSLISNCSNLPMELKEGHRAWSLAYRKWRGQGGGGGQKSLHLWKPHRALRGFSNIIIIIIIQILFESYNLEN